MLEEMLRGGNRGIVGFDPTTIPGCTVWFDAADIGTMSLSVSSLQSWKSKGSATCTATYKYNAPTVSTISGLSTIYFNGVSTMMTTNAVASYGATETTWITCAANFRAIADTASSVVIATISGSAGAERSIRFDPNSTAYSVNTSVLRGSSGDNANGIRGFIDTAAYFASFTNGALVTSNITAVTFQPGYNQGFQLGQWGTWLNGYVYEILIYNRALSLGEYQSVEGYLSQKWGFSPAKAYVPTSIPGCALWLDGADTGTLIFSSGSNISSWVDKSGASNNANIVSATPPTYSSASKAVVFTAANSTGIRGNMSSSSANASVFIVSSYTSNSGTPIYSPRLFILGSNNSTDNNLIGQLNLINQSTSIVATYVGNGSGNAFGDANQQTGGNISFSTPYLYTNISTYSGTTFTNSTLVNGYAGTYATKTGTMATGGSYVGSYNRYAIGTYTYTTPGPNQDAYNGNVYEVIVYYQALTADQRQAVEGYLAWKWNLQGSLGVTHPNYLTTANFVKSGTLVSTHPFYSQMPMTRPFTPLDLPGCFLWFDAADKATITTSGTNVTQWTNKGSWVGSATNLTGYFTSGTATYNGLNIIQAPVGTHMGFTVALTGQARAWFAVFRQTTQLTTTGITQYFAVVNQTAGSGQDGISGPGSPTNTATASYSMGEGASGIAAFINTVTAPNGYNIMAQYAWINSAASTSSNYITVNGAPMVLNINALAASYRTDSVQYTINTAGYNNSCDIAEIIMFNNEITVAQRQSVEGYLAAKWGLKPQLPAFVNPRSIPGCSLWLDGTDPAGTGIAPANNSIVSTWVDKSGTGNNGTSYGSPTFVTSAVNSKPSISFDGSTQRFSGPITNTGTTVSAFAVGSMNSGGAYGRIITLGSTTNYDGGITPLYFIAIMRLGTTQNLQSYRYTTATANSTTLTYNAPFQAGTVVDGTNDILYVNGTGGTSSSSTGSFGYTQYGVGREPYTQAEFFQGYISEIIVYNAALTAAQRQSIEGYLGWKWGVQAQLPATHPYYALVPVPHPFYRVPPTIRQPALYYDVAPGNWTRDWQPYLRALTQANAGATASFSSSSVTGSSGGYLGGVLAPNGKIYCIPRNAVAFGVIDPFANTFTTFGSTATSNDYIGGVLAPNGKIYCIPGNATAVHIIDPTTNTVSTNSVSGTAPGNNAYGGGVLAPNGKIYCVPLYATSIGIIDPIANTFSISTFPAGTITGTGAGSAAYEGGVLAPNGKIYLIPNNATSVGVIDPVANTFSTTLVSGSSSGTYAYIGGVLAPNGKIYCLPHGATTVGLIDPVAKTFTTFGTTSGGYLYQSGVLGPDGKIYSVPTGTTSIAMIDPAVNTYTTFGTGGNYIGGVLASNGKIYCIPFGSSAVGVISFSGLTQTPSLNYCLSAYTNKL